MIRFIPTNVGNTILPTSFKVRTYGSSPRTWGILELAGTIYQGMRFIPTNVGNTAYTLASGVATSGSSPRTWGIRLASMEFPHIQRFIPTNVGNTRPEKRWSSAVTVHPHERGEYGPEDGFAALLIGSSPRTWGILHPDGREGGGLRFIPTNVGNTKAPLLSIFLPRFIPTNVGNTPWCPGLPIEAPVHPHERGEYAASSTRPRIMSGSSPRTWGIH